MTSSKAEEGAVNLVGATKHPMVVGDKIFMRAEGIPRDEGEVQLVGSKWRLTPRSWTWPVILDGGSRWREHAVV